MNPILEFLNRPYPFSFQPLRRVKQILPIGICVFLFLVLFKPFGGDVFIIAYMVFAASFAGLLTTVLIPLFFPKYFDEAKWTIKRNLIWVLWMNIIFVTILFFANNILLIFKFNDFDYFTFKNFLHWVYIQLIFGIPLGIIINLVNQFYLLKKHLKIAENINNTVEKGKLEQVQTNLEPDKQNRFPNNELNTLEFEIDKFNKVMFDVDNLIYVEALGNYINIFYLYEEIRKITIRETISNIEEKIGASRLIYKPHRSYLVNLKSIENVTGDSQGLKIHLKGYDRVIPVSRNKIKEFKMITAAIL
jgi:hypothetical protein